MQPIQHTHNFWAEELIPRCPASPFLDFPNASSLIDRVSDNWKVLLMDCSTIIAVTCFVTTFFLGYSVICVAFLVTAIASGVAAFYMRRFSTLQDLEDTAKGLKETKEKFEEIAKDLEKENRQLAESNRELQRNNTLFQQNNTRLNTQVTQLTLQVVQLRESSQRIRSEVIRFEQENNHLHTHVRGFDESLRTLDQQIVNSRALCDQIAAHLSSQEMGLGQQLEQLGRYLADLRADNRVGERIQQLSDLHLQVLQSTNQLHEIQVQYATERANFQAIHSALVQIKDQFDAAIRDAASDMQANNQQFRNNVTALAAERQRINDLISRHFASGTTRVGP
jgi:chromosome segregation ATPase